MAIQTRHDLSFVSTDVIISYVTLDETVIVYVHHLAVNLDWATGVVVDHNYHKTTCQSNTRSPISKQV